mmetsp:Transcript_63006/g.117864  ORF Transcript_63006/g.117864 Transcript_63006/m.117864 type:complete len:332 (-) Transcript_63006:212-1207(-)
MGGSGSKVTWKENSPSPSDPSQKSVLSEPLEEVSFTDEAFWKHLGALKREALALPMYAKALGVHVAKHEVMDRDDGTFLVTTTIGGYYGGEVDVNFIHSYDADTNTWTQKCDRDPGLQKVSNQVCFRLHESPRIVEMWCVNDPARNAGVEVVAALQGSVGLAIYGLSGQEVAVDAKADQPSKDGSGKLVAQSAALDDHIKSGSQFLEAAMKAVKDGKGMPGIVEFTIIEDNGNNFKTKEVTDLEGTGETKVSYLHHVFDMTAGTASSTTYKDETFTTPVSAWCTKTFDGPVVVEMFTESYPVRHAGPEVVKNLGPQVEGVLAKAVEDSKAS